MEDIPLYVGKRKNILILSGGGIKGFATLGALKCLFENEILVKPEIICGTSAGAGIGFFLILGYTPQDIFNLFYSIDLSQLLNNDFTSIFDDICFGLNSVDSLMHIIIKMLEKKNIDKKITFKQLYEKFKIKFIVTGTCLNDVTVHYFSVDTEPDMQVLKAIRISLSIPLIFKPYKYKDKLWIDGACIDNYPIALFKDKLSDTIGILLDEDYENISTDNFDTTEKYLSQILNCLGKGTYHSKYDLYNKNTIHIKCKPDKSSNWDVTNNYKKELFDIGYNTTKKFFNLDK